MRLARERRREQRPALRRTTQDSIQVLVTWQRADGVVSGGHDARRGRTKV